MEEENNELPENKEEQKEVKKDITERVRENPWILSTIVLGAVMIILIGTFSFGFGVTGMSISEKTAGEKVVDFVKTQTGENTEIVEVNKQSGLYEVVVLYQGKEIPVYLTLDGENLIQGITPLSVLNSEDEEPEQFADIPKSDKPKVELFVMTHCPYGTQAEKGFILAVESLGNSVDAKIRFIHYFMHEPEKEETPRQVCIREEQGDKWYNYLKCFLKDGDAERCLNEAKIDKTKIQKCVDDKSDEYYNVDSGLSKDYGVQGSPTLVINREIANSGRSPSAYLGTICTAFNDDKVPEACATKLPDTNYSPGFGYTETSSESASAQC